MIILLKVLADFYRYEKYESAKQIYNEMIDLKRDDL